MASSFTVTKLLDGSVETIIKVDIVGDTSDELVDAKIFDVTAYLNTGVNKKIATVKYALDGFSGELFWEGSSNIPLLTLEKDKFSKVTLAKDGFVSNSGVAGKTGSILLTTNGLTDDMYGYIILHIKSRDPIPGRP